MSLWFNHLSAVVFSVTVDEVDAESNKMDTNFSLAGINDAPKNRIRMECKCGVESCRKYLF